MLIKLEFKNKFKKNERTEELFPQRAVSRLESAHTFL